MFKMVLEKAEEPEVKLTISAGSSKNQECSRKTTISALLTMPTPSTVSITINCGKFWKRWEYQTTWPASWERAERAETPVLWPPHAKSWLIGKDPDAGRDCGQEEKGTTEDKMAGWHHWLDGHEFELILGFVMDREAWHAAIHGVAKSRTCLSDWTELNPIQYSYLENSMDRGAWQDMVHGIAELDLTEQLTLTLFLIFFRLGLPG